jgi:uncharacterized protein YfeS
MNKKEAHPNALKLLKSNVYWNSSEATLPFYNEDAFDALESISEWNTKDEIYLGILNYLETKGHGDFDYLTLDKSQVEEYNYEQNDNHYFATFDKFMAFKEEMYEEFEFPGEQEALFDMEFERGAADAASIHIDQTIIAVVFASFIKKGELTTKLFQLGKAALERELMEFSLLKFSEDEREERKEELSILLNDLKKIIIQYN